MTPSQPDARDNGWPWLSWPRMYSTVTLEQSISPSSGSVTVTVNGTRSPKPKNPPLTGVSSFTVGSVLPTVITTLALPDSPPGSVTDSFAWYWPFSV